MTEVIDTGDQAAAPKYRALDMLIKQHAPKVAGRGPYMRPRPATPHALVRTPAWAWRAPVGSMDGLTELCVLDANAAYLSAASSVEVAHGALHQTGPRPFERRHPGYWLVAPPAWNDNRIMHPLGTIRLDSELWLTTPTMALLQSLAGDGLLEMPEVLDSWTCETPARLRAWTAHIKLDRDRAIDRKDQAQLDAIKLGYSQAVTMMGLEEGSKLYRPDWAQHIRAQHAASVWRKAHRCLLAGHPPLAAGSVDELMFPADVVRSWWRLNQLQRPVPIVVDLEGKHLGTFSVKGVIQVADTRDDE